MTRQEQARELGNAIKSAIEDAARARVSWVSETWVTEKCKKVDALVALALSHEQAEHKIGGAQ